MNPLDVLKKGFGYVLLSMGVSRPQPKPKPPAKPGPDGGGAASKNADGAP